VGVSVADAKLVSLLRKELQQAHEILAELRRVLQSLNNSESREAGLERLKYVRELKMAAGEYHAEYLGYLSRVGRSLVHREEWVRIGLRIVDFLDKLSGMSYRLSFLIEKSWIVPQNIQKLLICMCEGVDAMTLKLDSVLHKLQTSPHEALEDLREISRLENTLDETYRAAMFEILSANISSNTALLLLSISEMLENSSDTLYELTNNLYIILLDTL
jgi:hypothetical protein